MQVWLHLSRGVRRLVVHPIYNMYIMYRCNCSLSISDCGHMLRSCVCSPSK